MDTKEESNFLGTTEIKVVKVEQLRVYGEPVTLHTYERKHNRCGHFGSKFIAEYKGFRWDPFNYGREFHEERLNALGIPQLIVRHFMEDVTEQADERLTENDDLAKAYDTLEHFLNMTRRIDPDEAGESWLAQRGARALKKLLDDRKVKL